MCRDFTATISILGTFQLGLYFDFNGVIKWATQVEWCCPEELGLPAATFRTCLRDRYQKARKSLFFTLQGGEWAVANSPRPTQCLINLRETS